MHNTQIHLFISGMVQGVGYRQFIKSYARKLNITGWVQNLADGRVEAVLHGEKSNVDQLIAVCKKGPFLAEVRDVSITMEQITEYFAEFTIRKMERQG